MAPVAADSSVPHPLNRHLFVVDNYRLLKSMDTESIDLICTDPPFAKNDTFVGSLRPPLTENEIQRELDTLKRWGIANPADAERLDVVWPTGETTAMFTDIWSWESDVHEQWMDEIRDNRPSVLKVIETTRHTHSEGTAAYSAYMAIRLIECHRVLKSSGSLYLHCDNTANSYLRLLLDAIFGEKNFRNEIVWRIGWVSGFKTQKRGWIRNHDTILYYVKSEEAAKRFNKEYLPYPADYVRRDGKRPTGKGFPVEDTWNCHKGDVLDSIMIKSFSGEKTGYPTQKPVALAERIVKASSDPGEVVFDPFAGCAYIPVAAERLGRQWIACDISPRALTVLRRQFEKFGYAVDGETPDGILASGDITLARAEVTVRGPNELPTRVSPEDDVESVKPLPPRRYKTQASIFSRTEMLEFLLGLSEWGAWCCGFANWKQDYEGSVTVERTIRNFELDHIDLKSKQGRHEIDNRAPLCPHHNSLKSDRRVALEDLRIEIVERGELVVPSVEDLVDLAWARDQAIEHLITERARQRVRLLPDIA